MIMENTAIVMNENRLKIESDIFKPTPATVEQIAKNATALFYDSLTTKNLSCESKRLDVITFLRALCRNGSKRLRIDDSNYDCYFQILLKAFVQIDKQPLEDNFVFTNTNFTKLITEFNQQLKNRLEEKARFNEIILQRDRRKYTNDSTFDSSFFSQKRSDVSQCCIILNSLNDLVSCKEQKEHRSFAVPNKASATPNNIREKQLTLAYALLNFPKSPCRDSILIVIITKLSEYSSLKREELELVTYLWQKCDKQSGIPLVLLEKFPFIYERKFIGLCKAFIAQEDCLDNMLEDCKIIMKVCSGNRRLQSNIINSAYQLFALSNYDKPLYSFLQTNNFITFTTTKE